MPRCVYSTLDTQQSQGNLDVLILGTKVKVFLKRYSAKGINDFVSLTECDVLVGNSSLFSASSYVLLHF